MDITAHTARRAGLGLGFATTVFLFWAIGALGVIGSQGDPADLMYLGVLGIVVGGSAASRLEDRGMARTMVAAVAAHGLVALVALLHGEHQSPVTSVVEILGLNAMFMVLFAAAALLLRFAADPRRGGGRADSPIGPGGGAADSYGVGRRPQEPDHG